MFRNGGVLDCLLSQDTKLVFRRVKTSHSMHFKFNIPKLYYSKFAKDHFFDVRYFVHIITIYNQIATKDKSVFRPHKRVMQLLI